MRHTDLDVVLTAEGRVKVLDEDEVVENQVLYSYPPDLIASARRAADSAAVGLGSHAVPFDGAAEPWLAMVEPESLS